MAKSLYCPKCKIEYWGDDKGAKCVCGYLFTETDKRKAMGLTDAEFKKMEDEMVEALTKVEEEQTDMTLTEAINLVLEPAEFFIADAKEGTIAKSPRFRRAVSYLREFVEN